MKVFKKTFQYGEHEVTLETGGIARQASGSVMVRIKDTAVLVTAVTKKRSARNFDVFYVMKSSGHSGPQKKKC